GVSGVVISGSTASGNAVYVNFIGTDPTGTAAVANTSGVFISGGAHNNLVGGPSAGLGNVIARNTGVGVDLSGSGTTGNAGQGNRIGGGVTGGALPNLTGVFIEGGASNNLIGGTAPGAGNFIDFNTGKGVVIRASAIDTAAVGNAVLGNNIFGNGGLGIDLSNDGVTNNHPSGTSGPNDLQNFPVLTLARLAGSDVVIRGTL